LDVVRGRLVVGPIDFEDSDHEGTRPEPPRRTRVATPPLRVEAEPESELHDSEAARADDVRRERR
jgi:hypothetical protein